MKKGLVLLTLASLLILVVSGTTITQEKSLENPAAEEKVGISPLGKRLGKTVPKTIEELKAITKEVGIKWEEEKIAPIEWEKEEAVIKELKEKGVGGSGYFFEGTLHWFSDTCDVWRVYLPRGVPSGFAIIWNEGDLANRWNDLDLWVFDPKGNLACNSIATKTVWEGCTTNRAMQGWWYFVVHEYSGLRCHRQRYKCTADTW